MSIVVISGASDRREAQGLIETAAVHRVPLHVVSPGGNDVPLKVLVDLLRARSEEYIVLTDAYDVLFSRWDGVELVALIDAEPSGLINSCESDCWPAGPWCAAYKQETPWWACNGGQVCGKREALVEMTMESQKHPITAGGGNQERLHRMIADGYPIGLDNHCRVFQSMTGAAAIHVECRERKVFNSFTRSWPMMLHFNGRCPGMETWRKALAQD